MNESMKGLKRTHMCCEVKEELLNKEVTLAGWVNKRRNLGKLIFISLRDRSGIIQLLIDGETSDSEIFKKAENIKTEYVIIAKGKVILRKDGNFNPNMETGKFEIEVSDLRILSESLVPPFQIADENVKDDLRLKYRYLDLRRPEIQKNLIIRHKVTKIIRDILNEKGFLEIETPFLTKSTPEGARDYIIPSRIYPGNFYALPQSPQIFKQLLMVAGLDKYYQIVKCFRDEDLRADRQPEFTQIDLELSFIEEKDIMDITENIIKEIFYNILNIKLETPFLQMKYSEAMRRFGTDKPDTRFEIEISDITEEVKDTEFIVFKETIENKGTIRGINAKKCSKYSRKQIDSLIEQAKSLGAKGLIWISVVSKNEYKTTLSKFLKEEKIKNILNLFKAEEGDLILISADKEDIVLNVLGNLRLEIAKRENLINKDQFNFLWVTDFPLLEWDEEKNRYFSKHHPFTMPKEEDIENLEKNPSIVKSRAYDIVLNGIELGGGSIRIHRKEIQEKIFKVLNFSEQNIKDRFGFLIEAFKYGVPPHGGIALGLDRLIMLLTKSSTIRDVIAFPKTKDAACLMTEAPNIVDENQIEEIGIKINTKNLNNSTKMNNN